MFIRPFAALLVASMLSVAQTPDPARNQSATAFVPFFKTTEHKFSGPLPSAEFFFQIPQHIELVGNQQFTIRFRASQLLIPDISTATIELNGSPVTSIRLPGKDSEAGSQTLGFSVPAEALVNGWNKVLVKCLMQTTDVHCRDVDNPACWFVLERGTGLTLSYKRMKLFPELARFPASVTEEQLLRQDELVDGFPAGRIRPVAALLMPKQLNSTAFRAFVIAASRLGQPGYLPVPALRVGTLDEWNRQSGETNGILLGLTSDLEGLDLPAETRAAAGTLKPAEGMLAEFITGEDPASQRRWILVCGSDGEGLTKAVLALGSSDALGTAPVNPWVVRETPQVSALTERQALPAAGTQSFENLVGGRLTLKGIFRNRASFAWTLPPGFETGPGSELLLEMAHASGLDSNSAVQIDVNDRMLQGIPLGKTGEQRKLVRLGIPEGIPGRSPNSLLVSSYLDIGTTDCGHRNEERAWVEFAASSFLTIAPRPLTINGLDRMDLVLLRDAFLRRACILLPKSFTAEDLKVVGDLALSLGKSLAAMPVLWPRAALYSAGEPVSPSVLENASVILLGRVGDWRQALPKEALLSINAVPGKDALLLQNTEVPFDQLPASLVFAQFLKSPWSADNCVVAVGGAGGIGGPVASRLLTDPEVLAKLAGTVAGLDKKGRVFQYDVRTANAQSLSESVLSRIPKGMSAAETEEKLDMEERVRSYLTTRNLVIAGVVLLVVLMLIRTQVRLMKIKAELRRKNTKPDSKDA